MTRRVDVNRIREVAHIQNKALKNGQLWPPVATLPEAKRKRILITGNLGYKTHLQPMNAPFHVVQFLNEGKRTDHGIGWKALLPRHFEHPADPNLVTGKREETNVPDQALYLMNNNFVLQQAEAMARRLLSEADTPREQFSKAFLLCYGRPANKEEVEASLAFLQRFQITAGADSRNRNEIRYLAFATFCQSLLISAEFRYLN